MKVHNYAQYTQSARLTERAQFKATADGHVSSVTRNAFARFIAAAFRTEDAKAANRAGAQAYIAHVRGSQGFEAARFAEHMLTNRIEQGKPVSMRKIRAVEAQWAQVRSTATSVNQRQFLAQHLIKSGEKIGSGANNSVTKATVDDGDRRMTGALKPITPQAAHMLIGRDGDWQPGDDGLIVERNMATSQIAGALGVHVIAGSYRAQTESGQPALLMELVHGTPAEEAPDIRDGAALRRGLVGLQLVDLVTAQGDRNLSNIMLKLESGQHVPVGIDNDLSFTTAANAAECQEAANINARPIGLPVVIDASMHMAINSLTRADLARMMGPDLATPGRLAAATSRLTELQAHVNSANVMLIANGEWDSDAVTARLNADDSNYWHHVMTNKPEVAVQIADPASLQSPADLSRESAALLGHLLNPAELERANTLQSIKLLVTRISDRLEAGGINALTRNDLKAQQAALQVKAENLQGWLAPGFQDNDQALAQLENQLSRLDQLRQDEENLSEPAFASIVNLRHQLNAEFLERSRHDFDDQYIEGSTYWEAASDKIILNSDEAKAKLSAAVYNSTFVGALNAELQREFLTATPTADERELINARDTSLQADAADVRARAQNYPGGMAALLRDTAPLRKAAGSETLKAENGQVDGIATRNWQAATEHVAKIAHPGRRLSLEDLQALNRLLSEGLPAEQGVPGDYRKVKESTAASGRPYPMPSYVPEMMDSLMKWYEQHADSLPPTELAGLFAHRLVSIHPFPDANGRTARLAADAILQSHGLPPATYSDTDALLAALVEQENPSPAQYVDKVARSVQATLEAMTRRLDAPHEA